MTYRDLAVFLLATLEEYALITSTEMSFDDMPDGIADLLDQLLQNADMEAVASLGEVQSFLYSNGTSPIVEHQNDKDFSRWIRLPDDPTGPTDAYRTKCLARLTDGEAA